MKKIGRLHVITDTVIQKRYSHVELAGLAIKGGADTIQFRSKTGSTRELIETAAAVKRICEEAGVPLIINDRVDVAIAVKADGVHLGQDDFPVSAARKLLGPDCIIGGSAGNIKEAGICCSEGADYVGIGPVYETGSKNDAGPPTGIDNLKDLISCSSIPVIAIGGITQDKIPFLMNAGAYGVAVISAVCSSDDPEGAAKILMEKIKRGRSL